VEKQNMRVPKALALMGRIGLPVLMATTVLTAQNRSQGNIFRATTNYVGTEVVVRDTDNRFIPDLRVEEFKVFEDGVPQTITTFQPWIGGRAVGSLGTVGGATRPAAPEGLILPASRPRADSSGRLFMIFIDDLHLQPGDTPQIRKLLEKVRDTLVHENDLVGFVSSGKSSIAIDPSYDFGHRRFNEAINKVMGGGMTLREILDGAATEGSEGPVGLRYNAHVTFSTAFDLIDQMGNITDRRKVFIYVSNGYNFNPFAEQRFKKIQDNYAMLEGRLDEGQDPNDGVETDEEQQQTNLDTLREDEYKRRTQFKFAELTDEVAQVVRAAQRANVTFYTIDPRGLIANYGDASTQEQISYADYRDHYTTQISTLKVLAEETGGFALVETNDFDRGLRRIDAETSDFYILGYTSTNPDPFKIRRQIKIEVTRPGVQELIYRQEYTIPRPKGR
jgi:VWFA-related protein